MKMFRESHPGIKRLTRFAAAAACLITAALITACGYGRDEQSHEPVSRKDPLPQAIDLGDGAQWDVIPYELTIPEADREYRFVIINDLHIIKDSEEILPDKRENVLSRMDGLFIDGSGNRSAEVWPSLCEAVNGLDPDAVIIAGDLVDFYSRANMSALKEGLGKLSAPYMYLRADHDVGGWNTGLNKETIREEESALCPYEPILSLLYPGFSVVGINDSTSQITEEGASALEELLADKGRPVILFTHVPFEPESDAGLAAASYKSWEDRSLVWGSDSYYEPDPTTQRCMDLIFDGSGHVRAVFAGHLHFRYDGPLTETIEQHVLDANYKGNISVLTVKP